MLDEDGERVMGRGNQKIKDFVYANPPYLSEVSARNISGTWDTCAIDTVQ